MSALDPEAPSQPTQQTGLDQAQNPASKTGEETNHAADKSATAGAPIDHREEHDVPSQHGEEAKPSSLGYGDTGPLKEKDISESDAGHQYSDNPDLEGEQIRPANEGDVAHAVKTGGGGGHADEASLTADLDQKQKAHADELHKRGKRTGKEIEEEENEDWTGKRADVNVAEALGGRGNKVVLAPEE